MAKRRRYVFLCMNERQPGNPKGSCMQGGAEAVRQRFSEILVRENLKDTFRVVRTSCLDNCSRGPTLAIYPDDVWYQGVRPEDVEEIVESHLKNGRPVERLVLAPDEFD